MDGRRTTKRQYSEYSDFFLTQQEPEYDQDTDPHERESTHVRWGGQDGRREPDSVLGYTQDYRSWWKHENCFHPDSVSQRTEQPASHKCRAGDRPAGDRIPEEMDRHGDNRWDIPWKRVLFTSDGTDSTTFGSSTLESHADRPPDVEYSERLMTEKRQYEWGTERLCSPHIKLEMVMMQLQKDLDDCHTEFEITRMLTPAVDLRPPRQARFTSTPVPRSGWRCTQRSFADSGVSARGAGILLMSFSDHHNSPGCLAEYKRQFQRVVRRPRDDPSIFAIELETLARRAFIDIDISIQLQMVCDRFIDGQG